MFAAKTVYLAWSDISVFTLLYSDLSIISLFVYVLASALQWRHVTVIRQRTGHTIFIPSAACAYYLNFS